MSGVGVVEPAVAAAAPGSAAATLAPKKRLPGWLSMPGGPPEPNVAAFRSEMKKLADQKRELLTEVKGLRALLAPRKGHEEVEKARDEMRQRTAEIESQLKIEQERRHKKTEEIHKIKKVHDDCLNKLRKLSDGLGGFKTVKEIDEAIAYMSRKMETSGGGLAAEKRALRQIGKLEEAKKQFSELQPLNEVISKGEHSEAVMQRELQEINERIRNLTSKHNEERSTRIRKEQELRETGVNRQEVYKKCDAISAEINKLNEEMSMRQEELNKAMDAWNTWREVARAEYAAKLEAKKKERERQILERKNAAKFEEKRARALRRQNPYEVEADACGTLVRYLREQKMMVVREEEEKAKKEAAAVFDPSKFAPEGAVVLNDGKKGVVPGKRAVGGQKNKQGNGSTKNRVLQHSEDRVRLFQLIGVEPPLALAAIDDIIQLIRAKQKEYESHIKTGELELSSDDEDEEKDEAEHDTTVQEAVSGVEEDARAVVL